MATIDWGAAQPGLAAAVRRRLNEGLGVMVVDRKGSGLPSRRTADRLR